MAGGPGGITPGYTSPRPTAPLGIGAAIEALLAPPCFPASPGIRFLIAGNRPLTAHLHCESPRCGGPRSEGTGSVPGSFERFIGILNEDHAGHRAELDRRNEKIGCSVREHSLAKVPVPLVVGRREAEGRQVAVRRFGDSAQPVLALAECVTALAAEAQPPDKMGGTDTPVNRSRGPVFPIPRATRIQPAEPVTAKRGWRETLTCVAAASLLAPEKSCRRCPGRT